MQAVWYEKAGAAADVLLIRGQLIRGQLIRGHNTNCKFAFSIVSPN